MVLCLWSMLAVTLIEMQHHIAVVHVIHNYPKTQRQNVALP